MKFIIDGDYNKDLIALINKEKLPVSHIIVHVPQNPIGNSSIFLPKNLPSIKEFEEYTKMIQENGIIPIAGLDSTCQGNLEAHFQQFRATKDLIQNLKKLGYKDVLLSSPNNIGFFKENAPTMKIYLSYSQCVTSLNRGKIFFEIGADIIILNPDILRYFNVLENFIKLKNKFKGSEDIDYILPLNIGCNWGCIHWYQHHNLQSHRTIVSPVFSNQEELSDVEDEFDYPLLYCWKKRLEKPENLLKAGWISPSNIKLYEDLGYNTFSLYTGGFASKKIIEIIKSYTQRELKVNFNEFINIPQPYGEFWPYDNVKNSLFELKSEIINEFCNNYSYDSHYPSEKEINDYCNEYSKKLRDGNVEEKAKILRLIDEKMKIMEKGVIQR